MGRSERKKKTNKQSNGRPAEKLGGKQKCLTGHFELFAVGDTA